jgi:endoglucanase
MICAKLNAMNGLQRLISISFAVLLAGCSADVVAGDRPQIKVSQAYLVKPDILTLQINSGQVVLGKQVPYQKQFGDQVKQPRPVGDDWVSRGGQEIGSLAGPQRNILRTFDQVVGARLDPQWADQQTSYKITSSTDSSYSSGITPTAVFRKSKPTNMARTGAWKFDFPVAHTVYLKLPSALKPGKTYQLNFSGGNVERLSFKYEPNVTRSEAVHVSQLGFHPNDSAKVAFLSTWMGSGGKATYPQGLNFSVIDEATNRSVYTGKTKLSRASNQPEDPENRNHTLTDVHLLDFTSLQKPGRYRACVDTVGCSLSFQIDQTVWQQAFYVSARGLYHQRSGIELGPPYTSVKRPRPFHPKDGTTVYATTKSLASVDQGIGADDFSKVIAKSKTNEKLPNAWGGYFDAGDWDRRIQHVDVSRSLLEMQELAPTYFSQVNLNLPESNNSIPDVVDEALWNIDFYKRLQTSDGGIRGGIQSEIDPKTGEASWQESTTVLAYAPDAWSSYLYASVAARAAHWFKSKDAKRAQDYQLSAVRAVQYADRQSADAGRWQVRDARNIAALELYRLTGDSKWHQVFLQTTVFKDAKQETNEWDKHNQRDAAFLYARLPQNQTDRTVQQNAFNALIREADAVTALTDTTAFKWSKQHPYEPIGWGAGLGAPKAVAMVRAHYLTNNSKYLKGSVLASQFSLGANPDNMTYTTGLGQRSPQNPLVIDQRMLGQAPPPGITVYGPYDPVRYGDFWTIELLKPSIFPAPNTWPTVESYFDVFLFPMATEFTVMQSISPTAYVWGYLAAQTAPNLRNAN